jgi:hypothetical protein
MRKKPITEQYPNYSRASARCKRIVPILTLPEWICLPRATKAFYFRK